MTANLTATSVWQGWHDSRALSQMRMLLIVLLPSPIGLSI